MANNNMVSPQEQLPIDEITSPLGDQIFEFCESELFPETLQNSEVASSSNCCYEEHSSFPTPLSITIDNEIPPPPTAAAAPPSPTARATTNLPMFMEDQNIEDSIDFNLSPSNFSVPHDHQYYNNNQEVPFSLTNQIVSAEGPQLYAPMAQECLPPFPGSYNVRLRSNSGACTVADPVMGSYISSNTMNNGAVPFGFDNSWLFTTGGTSGLSFLGNEHLSNQEMESQGDNAGFFMPDSLARVFNCSNGDLQTLSSESQHLLNGSPGTTLASEISSLEDPTFKVGKISAEERKRKINRYLKKRNERNFSKKIKYACRKTLADSRPRVRGRFAKNDELGELARTATTGQDDDVDDDVRLAFSNHIPDHHHHKVVKEEGSMDEIDRMFTNMNEVNSFKCNAAYTIGPWA